MLPSGCSMGISVSDSPDYFNDLRGGSKHPWVTLFPGQGVLVCIRNLTMHKPEREPNVALLHGLCLQVLPLLPSMVDFNSRL